MGENGSVLVNKDGSTIVQPAILAPKVVDTTGAGDTFTAAYAVALIERHSPADALRFAGTLSLQVTHAFELFIFFNLLLQIYLYTGEILLICKVRGLLWALPQIYLTVDLV
jgi:hypothetical protein